MLVSWLFLFASVWGAWFTWNAYRPRYSPAPLATVSFFAGWLTSELAVHHIVWQALMTVVFGWAGAFAAWPGQLGLAITGVSWLGLARCYWRARDAEQVVDAALQGALGADYAERIPAEIREWLAPRIDWRQLLMPFPIRHPEIERVRNVPYTQEAGGDLLLDVYRHRDRPTGSPVLLQIHGGAWILGSKDEQGLPLMLQLASRGWVCVSINYRLSPRATFPDPLVDVKRAIKWVREHVAEYGGDPDFLVVTGGSAGGHLASLTALTANEPEYQPGFESVDTRVDGCVAFYGVYDFTDRHRQYRNRGLTDVLERHVMKAPMAAAREAYEKASPMSRVHPDAPPFFVIHGDSDTLVPVADARHFVDALRQQGREPVVYAEIPGAQHAFEIFPSLRTTFVVHGVERFLAHLYARHRALGSRPSVPSADPRAAVS
jgi:acetyl esterase/lipase